MSKTTPLNSTTQRPLTQRTDGNPSNEILDSPNAVNNTQNTVQTGNPEVLNEDFDFDDVNPFSFRKPKDTFAGLSSGLKNLGKGILGGVAALLVAPCKYLI